jgi:replicative DNA helicase
MAEVLSARNIDLALDHVATEGRIPPQAVDIEAQVLGAMLLEREAIAKVIELLTDDAFHAEYHRKIYLAMTALFERGEPIDSITLSEELRRRGQLESIGGESYLVELTMRVTSAAHVEYHARIVLEKALLRNLIAESTKIISRAYGAGEDAFDLLDSAEQAFFQIAERRMRKSFVSMNRAVHDTFELLEKIHGTHGGVTGVPTGFPALNTLTGGWQNSDLIIVAGRPSSGKTAFALSLARNAALQAEKPTGVGIFSLEMATRQLIMRLLCAEAKVDAHQVRTGRLPEDEWGRLTVAAGRLSNANIFIDDTASLGILELRAKARRLKAEKNIGLIIVDYLQLMQGPKSAENREKEIAAISRSLKALAKELAIPVIAISQLSRAVEGRTDKRPILSDLRESGAIEQDADVVIFVHRPEMYLDRDSEEGREAYGKAEIIVGKQRNGPIDNVDLVFVHRYARFENPAPTSMEMVPAGPEETPF